MNQRRAVLIALGTCLLVCAFATGYRLRVLAEGAPTKQPLFYSGVLEVDGALASGDYTISVSLHDAATKGHELCTVESKTKVDAGRFRIDTSDCADAVAGHADTWVEVSFEDADGKQHTIPGRAKIGAVPYALEAQHAVSADAPSGALADTIQQLSARVDALEAGSAQSSAFLVFKGTPQTIDPGDARVVLFNDEQLDVNDEYDPDEGKFTAKAAGLYSFSCTISWDVGAGLGVGTWEAALQVNGFEYTYSGGYNDGQAVTRTLTGLIQLERDGVVTCTALQTTAAAGLHISAGSYNVFSGHRIR